MRYDPREHSDFIELPDCAARMGLTVPEVRDLVRRRALRAFDLGAGIVLVQPAILSGAV